MKMSPEQKRIAEQLTSIFENGTTEIQYAYTEDLGDGRGITCGRAGFCTGTGDAYVVVDRFGELKPDDPLVEYLPELKRLNSAVQNDDTRGLVGFDEAWKRAAETALFRSVQDEVTDVLYWLPSQRHADELGLETPLARAFIFDTIIQHGEDDDPDGLGALISRTIETAGGTPASGVDEKAWLAEFIRIRRADLAHCYEESSRDEWAGSVGRCDAFLLIAKAGNYELQTPFTVEWENESHTIG